jgi:hypothetical protein
MTAGMTMLTAETVAVVATGAVIMAMAVAMAARERVKSIHTCLS